MVTPQISELRPCLILRRLIYIRLSDWFEHALERFNISKLFLKFEDGLCGNTPLIWFVSEPTKISVQSFVGIQFTDGRRTSSLMWDVRLCGKSMLISSTCDTFQNFIILFQFLYFVEFRTFVGQMQERVYHFKLSL